MADTTQAISPPPAVLAEADELEAGGHPREAIRVLTEANRAHRDPRIEERLVHLRHEAFETLDHPGPAQPPAAISAIDGDPGPLPEHRPDELSLALLRDAFARHGCVLVRGLLGPDRVEHLVDGIDRALTAFDDGGKGVPPEETSPWYRHFKTRSSNVLGGGRRTFVRASGGVWAVDSPRMLFDVLEMVEELGIGALVSDFLGEPPALSANKCNLRRVPPDTHTNWHQDGAFLGGAAIRSFNLWLGLSHCGRDAPGLDIFPRRLDEVLPTGTEGAIFDWSVSPQVVDQVVAETGTEVQRPIFEPGDAMIFDHLFLHRTGVDPGMTRDRYAIESWFFAPSGYPDGQVPIVY